MCREAAEGPGSLKVFLRLWLEFTPLESSFEADVCEVGDRD